MRKYPGETERGKFGKVWLTDAQEAWFMETFPVAENRRVAKAMRVSESTMHRMAREYGLKKSEKGLRGIRRRQARAVRRKCESNGYYDSLRGKKPSEAALEGYRRYVKSDTYRHPYAVMREEHPRKYRQICKRKSEDRKRVMEEERKRIRLGLRRKTRLHLPVNNYSIRELSRRYYALNRGYIVADRTDIEHRRVIWYDEDTDRGERFERNAVKDGWCVEPLKKEQL
jgi:hypothetical protein